MLRNFDFCCLMCVVNRSLKTLSHFCEAYLSLQIINIAFRQQNNLTMLWGYNDPTVNGGVCLGVLSSCSFVHYFGVNIQVCYKEVLVMPLVYCRN